MSELISNLVSVLGHAQVLTDCELMESYVVDQRRQYRGRPAVVVRPGTTEEVANVVRLAAAHGATLVPYGGNTSYCGGATADDTGTQVVVSLERMTRIREIDTDSLAIGLDAGVILADAQKAAEEAGMMLPLSLGSEGSARIGGVVSTNAGGLNALRYGVARDLVLGLEVVLPDGRILDRMLKLRKNNTGYDLRQLWIGAEGTLGIVTGVMLRLMPQPSQVVTAWIALHADTPMIPYLNHLRIAGGDLLTSFEIMRPGALSCVQSMRGGDIPVPVGEGGALLVEFSTASTVLDLEEIASAALEPLMENSGVADILLTTTGRQRDALWEIRESIPEAEKHCGGAVKHDISVPLSAIDVFLNEAEDLVRSTPGNGGLSVYGHAGDGNIHFNVLAPKGQDLPSFTEEVSGTLSQQIYDLADRLGGVFSAEHGVGRLKIPLLHRYGSPVALELMEAIKEALDPQGVMNPRSIIASGKS